MKYTKKQIDNLVKSIFEGRFSTTSELPEDLYFAIADYLKSGVYKGFGGGLEDFEFGTTDYDLLNELRTNIYQFSAAKVYTQTGAFEELVASSDNFRDYYNKALELYNQYNIDWAKAEYVTAIGQAQIGKQWVGIEENKEQFPMLRYVAVMDANTSEICAPLNGITLPVDDPLWNNYTPLNHFNCRCILEQVSKYDNDRKTSESKVEKVTKELNETVNDAFKMNPGKDGYIFSPEHPYFEVAKGDKGWAKRNFDLPIPEND